MQVGVLVNMQAVTNPVSSYDKLKILYLANINVFQVATGGPTDTKYEVSRAFAETRVFRPTKQTGGGLVVEGDDFYVTWEDVSLSLTASPATQTVGRSTTFTFTFN
jgi:hypothetical protein